MKEMEFDGEDDLAPPDLRVRVVPRSKPTQK